MDRNALRDALEAEWLSAALKSPAAFRGAQTRVKRDTLDAHAHDRTQVLRKALSASAADVQAAFEQMEERWKPNESFRDGTRVVSLLSAYARRMLLLDGREMILRVDRDDPGREILRWRFMSLALPPAILIAAATPAGVVPPASVRLLHAAMAPAGPVAHQHIHHTAALSFEDLWVDLRLRALLTPARFFESFSERAFCPGLHRGPCIGSRLPKDRACAKRYPHAWRKHLAEWAAMLRLAFFARDTLERHLRHEGVLAECKDCAQACRSISALAGGRWPLYIETARDHPWRDAVLGLRRQQRRYDERDDKRANARSAGDFKARLAVGERILLLRSFNRLTPQLNECEDRLYEKLLLQYLRIKTAVFALLVHPPGEPGLENFLDHFTQIKVYASETDTRIARMPDEPGLDVQSIEYRVAPDGWFKLQRPIEFGAATSNQPQPHEEGWLIHFQRKRSTDGSLPLYGDVIRSVESQADQIARSIEAQPLQLKTLRGIDLCGVEESQPCWVTADTLRRLRQRSAAVAARSRNPAVHSLRLTLHAGEDFHWLTSGVRAIAEPFVWDLFQRGDRLGHGIAITHRPADWWERKSQEVMSVTRFDRMLDLAFLAEYTPQPTHDQSEWLRVTLTEIVKELGLEPDLAGPPSVAIDVDVIATARALWRSIGRPIARHLLASQSFGVAGGHRHLKWLHRYFWTPSIQKRAAKEISLRLEDDRGTAAIDAQRNELQLLTEARKKVIEQLARWQICIESNPTSNLTVGSLESMLAQTSIHRRSTSPADTDEETLAWTISTDDPITFSTRLSDEYAYAWAGMVLRQQLPHDPAHARALLDEAAATSMRTRFTIPGHDDDRSPNRRGRDRTRRH